MNSLAKRFVLGTMLAVGGHYLWYLVIVVTFMGLERAKRCGEIQKGWGVQFSRGRELNPLD